MSDVEYSGGPAAKRRKVQEPERPAVLELRAPHQQPQTTPHFSQPRHIASFSYSPERELLLDQDRKDEALRFYTPPPLPCDLNKGFKDAVMRDDTQLEGLDSLLHCLGQLPEDAATDDMLNGIGLITWRGMLTRLATALYEDKDGWAMNAQVVDGTLYLEQADEKTPTADNNKIFTYYGYAFESYCTTEEPSRLPPHLRKSRPFETVNTNVQWCSVCRLNLEGFRILVGGEVDCIQEQAKKAQVSTNDFIELKTSVVIRNDRAKMRFERYKMLKFYFQSYLLGVPQIIVGFREQNGTLVSTQTFKTLELPRMIRNTPHAWNPSAALHACFQMITFIHKTVSEKSADANGALDATKDADGDLQQHKSWPVFRVEFQPGRGQIKPRLSITHLDGRSSPAGMLGIVTEGWFRSALRRKLRKT